MTPTKFRLSEWRNTQSKASQQWIKIVLKEAPTRATVRRSISNPFSITTLEWVAALVLAVAFIFTFFKVAFAATAYAHNLSTVLAHGEPVSAVLTMAFQLVAIIFFGLLATPGLIYFQLLDRDNAQIQEAKATSEKLRQTNKWYVFNLNYITPRMPFVIVYVLAGWLFYISSYGDGSVFEKYIPVIAEVTFAHLIGDIIAKRTAFSKLVTTRFDELTADWNKRKAGMEQDPDYLALLYQQIRADLTMLQRPVGGKMVSVNREWFETTADGASINAFIFKVYLDYTGKSEFVTQAQQLDQTANPVSVAPASKYRMPPGGSNEWTVGDLVNDLRVIGAGKDINERYIAEVYGGTTKARKAWRNGAQAEWIKS